jgi:hypothetical protein
MRALSWAKSSDGGKRFSGRAFFDTSQNLDRFAALAMTKLHNHDSKAPQA